MTQVAAAETQIVSLAPTQIDGVDYKETGCMLKRLVHSALEALTICQLCRWHPFLLAAMALTTR